MPIIISTCCKVMQTRERGNGDDAHLNISAPVPTCLSCSPGQKSSRTRVCLTYKSMRNLFSPGVKR